MFKLLYSKAEDSFHKRDRSEFNRKTRIIGFRKGFTLAELLIVVAIIGILVAVSIPIFVSQLDKSKEAVCKANRRSLLAEVRTGALTEDRTEQEVFDELYPADKDEFPCPKGGTFTFSDGIILCSKHSEDTVKINDTYDNVVLSGNIDSIARSKGDSVPMEAGTIFKVGDKYYIANDTYTNLKVDKDSYSEWMSGMAGSQNVTRINLDAAAYTESDLTGSNYFTKGSLYNYNGKLYVQYKNFYGNSLSSEAKNPANSTDKWTLLGTIA